MPDVNITIETEQEQAKTQALAVVQEAKAITVTDDQSCIAAGEFLKAIKATSNKVQSVFKNMKKKTYEAWRAVCDEENAMLDPLIQAETYLKAQLSQYSTLVEQQQEEERKRLQEAAAADTETAALEAAYAAEEAGRPDVAEDLLRHGTHVPAVVLPRATPQQKGISTRKKYKAQVTNLRALVAAVHAGTVPILALMPNQKWLDQQATSMQELFNIPGAKAVPETIIAVRAGK